MWGRTHEVPSVYIFNDKTFWNFCFPSHLNDVNGRDKWNLTVAFASSWEFNRHWLWCRLLSDTSAYSSITPRRRQLLIIRKCNLYSSNVRVLPSPWKWMRSGCDNSLQHGLLTTSGGRRLDCERDETEVPVREQNAIRMWR